MDEQFVKKQLKQLFKCYKKMDKKTRSQLNKLGFLISEEGKHYKITHLSNDRTTVTLGKTVSDFRAGRNIARDLFSIICYS